MVVPAFTAWITIPYVAPAGINSDKPDINGWVVVVVVLPIPAMVAEPKEFQPFPELMAPGKPLIAEVLKYAATSVETLAPQILAISVIITAAALLFLKLKLMVAFALLLTKPVVETVVCEFALIANNRNKRSIAGA